MIGLIAQAVVTYIMSAFLENYEGDKNAHRLLKYFTWTFIPVLNVDGYEYSHNTDRMVWKLLQLLHTIGFTCTN